MLKKLEIRQAFLRFINSSLIESNVFCIDEKQCRWINIILTIDDFNNQVSFTFMYRKKTKETCSKKRSISKSSY